MKSLLNLPKQECVGEWCPVFLNLRRPSNECVGRFKPIRVTPLSPEVFPHLIRVGKTADKDGAHLKQLLSSLVA